MHHNLNERILYVFADCTEMTSSANKVQKTSPENQINPHSNCIFRVTLKELQPAFDLTSEVRS